MKDTRNPSYTLTFNDAVEIHHKIFAGEFQNRIAACYDVNPGRISEIKTGQLHAGSREVALRNKAA